jgi:hypothetical protein|tara:strand:- start:2289 stop:3212 length:924 start_codon:yes stop_codon:yes gene_type:complete
MSDERSLEDQQKDLEEQIANAPLEIEITEEVPEAQADEESDNKEVEEAKQVEDDKEFSKRVQKRISTLVQQRNKAEQERDQASSELNSFKVRLDRLEQGNSQQIQNDFNSRYEQTRVHLQNAIEEGDTQSQVALQEQLADMRAAMRVAEMQRRSVSQQQISPTVGRAAQTYEEPTPVKAIDWWQQNRWFNSDGYERETAAARAIDVQLDLEGHDKNSDAYYEALNNRLKNMFPDLISGGKVQNTTERPRAKSRSPVAPTTGGPSRKGNRVKMTKDQLQMARELGITDEKALKAYEAEIQATQEANNA